MIIIQSIELSKIQKSAKAIPDIENETKIEDSESDDKTIASETMTNETMIGETMTNELNENAISNKLFNKYTANDLNKQNIKGIIESLSKLLINKYLLHIDYKESIYVKGMCILTNIPDIDNINIKHIESNNTLYKKSKIGKIKKEYQFDKIFEEKLFIYIINNYVNYEIDKINHIYIKKKKCG